MLKHKFTPTVLMHYVEQFPHLKLLYPFDNFETILNALDLHFPGLFNLAVLDNEIRLKQLQGSYVTFFNLIMRGLQQRYTVGEVVETLYGLLQNDLQIRECFIGQLIFVPPLNNIPSPQLGYLEKIATGAVKVAEPVSFLDMIRVTHFLKQDILSQKPVIHIQVINLSSTTPSHMKFLKTNSKVLVVNVNQSTKALAKWAIVDLSQEDGCRVFCESPLLETEKKHLEECLGEGYVEVSPGKSDNLISTGYTAIAWLDSNITKVWNFDPQADFNVLLADYLFSLFQGDVGPRRIHYRCMTGEYQRYFSKPLRFINDAQYGNNAIYGNFPRDPVQGSEQWGAHSVMNMIGFSMLGKIQGEEVALNDLAKTIAIVGSKQLSQVEFNQYRALSYRSRILRFERTLASFGSPPVLEEHADSALLRVPEQINEGVLKSLHTLVCSQTYTNSQLINCITHKMSTSGDLSWSHDAATTMVLTLFRMRAKKPKLVITLPSQYQLDDEEIKFIVNLMHDNPYVTQCTVNENDSLLALQIRLSPVFARNRWLAANGYRPPMIDNYWRKAAKYWLMFLHEQVDLFSAKDETTLFKHCVFEMGTLGIQAVLDFLNEDQDRQLLERIYGRKKPQFYVACRPQEFATCLNALISHLRARAYFPFSEIGFSYRLGNDEQLIELLGQFNEQEQFNQITLTDCVGHHPTCHAFIDQLTRQALTHRWIGLIVLPELEETSSNDVQRRELRLKYTHLNNVILRNRHEKASFGLLNQLQTLSLENLSTDQENPENKALLLESEAFEFSGVNADAQWPIQRGGGTQLQLQQQQEISQSRQLQKNLQQARVSAAEEPLIGELVTYETIDKLLKPFYDTYCAEHPIHTHAASLKTADETLLQGFFHTWINANPAVSAPYVIKSMTLDAAKVLLRRHLHFSSGLNPENLPQGFSTQRSRHGDLVLCYNPELVYTYVPNPLTIQLDEKTPEARGWKGDFRQLNLEAYLGDPAPLNAEDWSRMALFALMQPPGNSVSELQQLCANNPDVAGLVNAKKANKKKSLQYCSILHQAWDYAGMAGVISFLAQDDKTLSLSVQQACAQLLQDQPQDLQDFANTLAIDGEFLRALGQVYYDYGHQGLTLFLSKCREIGLSLGAEFFASYQASILSQCHNFSCFLSESMFITLNNMMLTLKPIKAESQKLVWQNLLIKHANAVGWFNIEALWLGFIHFIDGIDQWGITLQGKEFASEQPENMLMFMDRILTCLLHISDPKLQQQFFASLADMDMTHGGIHYALHYEGFNYFAEDLELNDFTSGTPTYSSNLKWLYDWAGDEAVIKMKRAIAAQVKMPSANYPLIMQALQDASTPSKDTLIWLVGIQSMDLSIQDVLQKINALPSEYRALIARHLHHALYVLEGQTLPISFEAMCAFEAYYQTPEWQVEDLLKHFLQGTLFEGISILWKSQRFNVQNLAALMALFSQFCGQPQSEGFRSDGLRLAALFDIKHPGDLRDFYQKTTGMLPVVQIELRLLIVQLLSLDFKKSDLSALSNPQNWQDILHCINQMTNDPARVAHYRLQLIEQLNARAMVFQFSKSGEFRLLTKKSEDRPELLSAFTDHEERLWAFLQNHIAVPREGDAKKALKPLLECFYGLQLSRTYLNEIEPLLAILEKTPKGCYWSANYFNQLFHALQPEDLHASFPISLLKVLLKEPLVEGRILDDVEKDFPSAMISPIKAIIKNTEFDREQQAMLCQLALREYYWQGSLLLFYRIMETLSSPTVVNARTFALQLLIRCKSQVEMEARFTTCCQLLQNTSNQVQVCANWTRTSSLWLEKIGEVPAIEALFSTINTHHAADPHRLALILHIVAWSSLHQGLTDAATYQHGLNKEAITLIQHLGTLDLSDLETIARYYPKQPSPNTADLLQLGQYIVQEKLDWKTSLEEFICQPFSEPRADYGFVAGSRQADLQRLIRSITIRRGEDCDALSIEDTVRISFIFRTLKQLEAGSIRIDGEKKRVSAMSQQELAQAFKRLCVQSAEYSNLDVLRASLLAVEFEVLARTTRKYPHLAQQIALIANDICLHSSSKVLQLSTGEGKTHFIAMRAARHAVCGRTVDICTAKRTLAQRDLEEYQSFFDYLDLRTVYIHPKSSREQYQNNSIHYLTIGDLSLFLDEQSYLGHPIEIDKATRVALFDEFDFMRFDEGSKTEYNYARTTGRTPKQMTWFYRTVNQFYLQRKTKIIDADNGRITVALLKDLVKVLNEETHESDERQHFVKQLMQDPLQLVQWLQSAHEAQSLQLGVGFTIREESILVGAEYYPMREIIPLSTDNQKMVGATFSAGVQQLLAVRLNHEARDKGEAQNFHIHPESNIVSSQIAAQRMQSLWGSWEGFTGTVSLGQASILYIDHQTEILQVPTNQWDLRQWHEPVFFADANTRHESLITRVRQCLKEKKSILFSCKNDREVKQIQEALASSCKDIWEQFVFYTNEDDQSPGEILEAKHELECWHGGQKQHGICLVASGFGRGDNVGVEVVCLFDVNDCNDLLQKGGRTARNGNEGDVYQFYLTQSLLDEEKQLLQILSDLDPQFEAVKQQLKTVSGDTAEKQCFNRVLLLREYLLVLQNKAQQGYRHLIAHYSTWGMQRLGEVQDPLQRLRLTVIFSQQLKSLEKQWIDITAQNHLDPAQKLIVIEEAITTACQRLKQSMCDEGIAIDDYVIAHYQFTDVPLHMTQKHHEHSAALDITGICSTLVSLPGKSLEAAEVHEISTLLEKLATHPLKLHELALHMGHLNSLQAFVDALQKAILQLNSSVLWNEQLQVKTKPLDKQLIDQLSSTTLAAYIQAMHELSPVLQDAIISHLYAPGLLSAEERVHNLLPLLTYLGHFSAEQQKQWGQDYISALDKLIVESATPAMQQFCRNAQPMKLKYFNAQWAICKRFATPIEQFPDLVQAVGRAIQAEPEQRMRLFAKWEIWANGMKSDDALRFLKAFSDLLPVFEMGKNWDVLLKLVDQTQAWWNKSYSLDQTCNLAIQHLWEQLASHKQGLPQFCETLKQGMALGGKSWFEVLSTSLKLTTEQLITFQSFIESLWVELEKKNTLEQWPEVIAGISIFYQMISSSSVKKKNQWIKQVLSMTAPKLNLAMIFLVQNQALLKANPIVFEYFITMMTHAQLSLEQAEPLSQALLQALAYHRLHPEVSLQVLLSGLHRFKTLDKSVGSALVKFNSINPKHFLESLSDKAIEYMAELDPSVQPLLADVMHRFYPLLKTAHGNPQQIACSSSYKALFDFADKDPNTTRQRVMFMHLLLKKSFTTMDVQGFTEHLSCQWDIARNEALLTSGFEHYTRSMQAVFTPQKKSTPLLSGRDLSIAQQHALLQLATEMQHLGKPVIHHEVQGEHILKKNLQHQILGYRAQWFKAAARQQQLAKLQSTLETQFDNDANDGTQSRYEAVYKAFTQAKIEAITQDALQDKKSWFNFNNGGKSRYFNTLNKMQDIVLRHWVQDAGAIHQFQAYHEACHTEFKTLTQALSTRLNDYSLLLSQGFSIKRLFYGVNKKDTQQVLELKNLLQDFQAQPLTPDKVEELIEQLRQHQAKLPGYLVTLVNEVLARGDAIFLHMKDNIQEVILTA